MNAACLLYSLLLFGSFVRIAVRAEEAPKPIALPSPQMEAGKPVMQALKERRSVREFSPAPLSRQMLSDLLWAAYGINRPENGHRTAPSAMNSQEIQVYVVLAEGTFVYDSERSRLQPVKAGDFRTQTGGQDFVKTAPVGLVFVADFDRLQKATPENKERYAAITAGAVVQNVYLYCASEGLGTVVHEVNVKTLSRVLGLKPAQKIIIGQSVGYPKTAPPGENAVVEAPK